MAIGALLGGDEFGFGTIAMIAVGCIMARICHTNKCPVGVTTQREALRKKFVGVPADVHNFFYYVADETRHVLAHMGYSSLSDLVGRADLLEQSARPLVKTASLDLSYISQVRTGPAPPRAPLATPSRQAEYPPRAHRCRTCGQAPRLGASGSPSC